MHWIKLGERISSRMDGVLNSYLCDTCQEKSFTHQIILKASTSATRRVHGGAPLRRTRDDNAAVGHAALKPGATRCG